MARVCVTPGICGVIVIGLYRGVFQSDETSISTPEFRSIFFFFQRLKTVGYIFHSPNSIGSFKNQHRYF